MGYSQATLRFEFDWNRAMGLVVSSWIKCQFTGTINDGLTYALIIGLSAQIETVTRAHLGRGV